jgi:lipoprotein-releasing system permease protein
MMDSRLADLTPGQNSIILGYNLAVYLGVAPGDNITVISPHVNSGSSSIIPKMYRFTVIGLFKFGLPDYDRNMAYIHINDAAQLFGYPTSVSALKVKLDDSLTAPVVRHSLVDALPTDYEVSDWVMENQSRFQAIKTEKKVMTIILLLMIIESAFSIVSALIMQVKEKRSDIAILKTMGLTSNSVMGIFVVLGTIIGITGTGFGVLLGVLLSTHISAILLNIEKFLNIKILDSKLFLISEFPSQLIWSDVYAIAGIAFLLSLLATIYPARQAANINPAEALRYE